MSIYMHGCMYEHVYVFITNKEENTNSCYHPCFFHWSKAIVGIYNFFTLPCFLCSRPGPQMIGFFTWQCDLNLHSWGVWIICPGLLWLLSFSINFYYWICHYQEVSWSSGHSLACHTGPLYWWAHVNQNSKSPGCSPMIHAQQRVGNKP